MATLWGKYHKQGNLPGVTLLEHTMHVVAAGDALFGTANGPTRLGECWLRFFKLPQSEWERFYWNLLAAELLHDWGKANDGMQRVLTGTGEQAIRHEHFSALLIGLPEVTAWLKGNKQIDVPLVLSAVLTHHLKTPDKKDWGDKITSGTAVTLVGLDGPFRKLLELTKERLVLGDFDVSTIPTRWIARSPKDIRDFRELTSREYLTPINRQSLDARRMLTAVRAALIAADSAGSGYARTGQPVGEAVWKQFVEREPLTGQYLKENIIDKRIAQIKAAGKWDDRGDGKEGWNNFQLACDSLPDRALLLAPCGSGKTLAAWRWIAAQAARRPVGRVLFLYPTRATAKEGFRDYVSWAPEADAALMHGNAAFDLNGMFDNGDARGDGSKYEADRRLFSLGYWPKRVFSATVDQFLGFLQYGYGPMCMLPVLADSVIVIDEVHSFDRHMFTALKEFLKNFNVPVLCMTATLPNDRREMLVDECGLTLSGEPPEDLRVISDALRYTLTHVRTREKAFDAVRSALAACKRVLWVANTVKRCHEITAKFAISPDKMETPDGVPVYCYHSRFKLSDRVNRHNDIIGALKVGQPGALGVTTQVCEMSLDLDVDLLVTEECPVTSLIQRMGRCNRERNARPLSESGTVLVYKADSDLPYSTDDLKGREEFMSKTTGRPLSQTDLESTLNGLTETPPWLGDNVIMFLKSGAYAVGPKSDDEDANTFREGNDYNRPCVLPDEVGKYWDAKEELRSGFILPVPKNLAHNRDDDKEATHRQLPKYLGVASAGHYHKAVGFCDKLITEWEAE